MKKIANIFFVFVALATLFLSCSKDNDTLPFQIVENTVNYSPLSSEGVLTFTTDDFSVHVEDEWCKIEKVGNQVKVSFSDNNTEINRSTLIHVIPASGADPIVVPITQVGLLFEVNSNIEGISYSLNGGVKKINIIRNIDYTVETDQPWLSHEIIGDTLYLKAEALAGVTDPNFMRKATATVKYGDRNIAFDLHQYTIYDYNDFMGEAYLSFINDASLDESKRVRIPVNINGKVDGKTFTITTQPIPAINNLPLQIDVEINADNTLEIISGQLLSSSFSDPKNTTVKRIYLQAYDVIQKAFCSTVNSYLKATANVGDGVITYSFEPKGQFSNNSLLPSLTKYYDPHGLVVAAHRDQNISSSSRVSAVSPYQYMMKLRLEK